MPKTMKAVRLHQAKDLRFEEVAFPPICKADEVLIKVKAVGICGSDLHTYLDGHIGDTPIETPMILGHEFSGIVEEVNGNALDGNEHPLQPGMRVAVDPAQPCFRCDLCERGHPNLCRRLHFCGIYPEAGCLAEYIYMPARCCFPLPDGLDAEEGALLEPLGVALHAINLTKLKLAESVVIQGAGAIGLLILQLAKLAGAAPVYVIDQFAWRLQLAKTLGADQIINFKENNPVEVIAQETQGKGVDVCIEAAWCDDSVNEGVMMTALGGRVLLVGISSEDQIQFSHSQARRKGLTIKFSRRMKHVYPTCIQLVQSHRIDLKSLVSHRFSLEQTPEAFRINTNYSQDIQKIVIHL